MLIVKADGLARIIQGKILFENISIEIESGQRVALIGHNGSGKTTLLKAMTGEISIERGRIQRHLPLENWSWMEQSAAIDQTMNVINFIMSGHEDIYKAKQRLDAIQHALERQSSDALLEEYTEVYDTYSSLGGYEWEIKTEKIMGTLEIPESLWRMPYGRLSGGQKTKAQLARAIVKEPRFLVLDEPTNHLDKSTIEWLEGWLQKFSGSVLFVSHDRKFIDNVANVTYELSSTAAKRYLGGYTQYRNQRDLELKTQLAEYTKQHERRKALSESIGRYRQWFSKTTSESGQKKHSARIKAKEQEMLRLESQKVDKPVERTGINLNFLSSKFEARTLLNVKNVSFAYENKPLLENINLSIDKNDRLAVIGPNGSGKSTLLKLLIGRIAPLFGEVYHNPQLKIGFLAQEVEDLNPDESILDHMLSLPHMTETEARTMLACFLFKRDEVYKRLGDISMGEQCRVAFIRLYFSGANLLVLDEPTNYLDIDTRERIEDALNIYPGTLLLVSHDRYMVEKLATRIAFLENKKLKVIEGNDTDYLEGKDVDIEKSNRIQQLQLRLIDLMNVEEPDSTKQHVLMEQIKRTRNELNILVQLL